MDIQTILLRFTIVFVFSLLFGLERQKAHKPISFGTFVFVAVGSCGLAIIATSIATDNPLSLLGAIVTGIGFLGAGALIKTTDKIFGFTSAASIWIFAILGLIIGLGEYEIGLIVYILIWIVISIDKSIEKKGVGSYKNKLTITSNKCVDKEDLTNMLKTKKYKIVSMDMSRKDHEFSITLLIEGTKADINQIPNLLYKTNWIQAFKIE